MVDEKKILQHSAEIAEHVNGAAQYLDALFGGRFVTKEQARDMVDYMFAGTKRNIESYPFASQEEKDAEIRRREYLLNMIKPLMGLSIVSEPIRIKNMIARIWKNINPST